MHSAFTLIELLVVVAIIAILAAIAVPNFLEAQTRAKVARAANDMRTLVVGMESYRLDNHSWPPSQGVAAQHVAVGLAVPISARLVPLTTPISYLSAIPRDSFRSDDGIGWGANPYDTFDYLDCLASPKGSGLTSGCEWRLCSAGPDGVQAFGGKLATDANATALGADYDPTNGTASTGDIVRVGMVAATPNGRSPADPSNPERPGIARRP